MTDLYQDLRAELKQAVQLPYGGARTSAVEEILSRAEALEDPRLLFDVRMKLIEAFTFGGEPAKAFPPFAACLGEYDRGAVEFRPKDTRKLLWRFKWIIAAMPDYPSIGREQVDSALADMERRFRIAGYSMHAVHTMRCLIHGHLGDREASEESFRLWTDSARDDISDCEACEASDRAAHHVWMGRFKAAVKAARPVVERRLTCLEEPQGILTVITPALVRIGKLDRARDAHVRAYRLHRGRPGVVDRMGAHLEFCARTGNEARGLEILVRHVGWLDQPTDPASELTFTASAALLLRRLEKVGPAGLTVERPALGMRPVSRVPIDELRAELEQRARSIAAQFDARNGNSYQGGVTEDLLAAEPLVDFLPLSAPERITSVLVPAVSAPSGQPLEGPELLAAALEYDQQWLRLRDAYELESPEALEIALSAVQLWRQTDDRASRAIAELRLGLTYEERSEWLDAAEALELARYDFEAAGLTDSSPEAEETLILLGECQQELHEDLDAGATFGQLADRLAAAGKTERTAMLFANAAQALAEGGEPAEAAVRYGQAAAAHLAEGSPLDAVRLLREQVDALADARNYEASHEVAVRAHELAGELPPYSQYAWLKASTTYDIAYALWQLDRNDEAIEVGRQAAGEYENSSLRRSAATTLRLVALICLEEDRLPEAADTVAAALDLFAAAGMEKGVKDVDKALWLQGRIRERQRPGSG
ncbi:hypothetical protein GCM10009765_75450 [Fodinicola feengrottensis]|uniref:Tetratricopeptide repeat protein n=1 Tax=Fodinicola feengrottensis TaxID=435914 RepID=A0ABN2J0M8_9ACTN